MAGFEGGGGADTVRDMEQRGVSTIRGKSIAVTGWGCDCCRGEETEAQRRTARAIAEALNIVDWLADHFVTADGDVQTLRNRALDCMAMFPVPESKTIESKSVQKRLTTQRRPRRLADLERR